MQFSDLYGTELTRELASSDTANLFTLVRRKAAINAAQLEFVKRTECLQRQTTVALVDDTQEYDLDAITNADFGFISKQGLSIRITSGSNVRYLEGDDLEETTVERLTTEEPGWRAVSNGTPTRFYIRADGGTLNLGLHPKPDVTGSDTWVAIVPYVCIPADMSADSDEPFTVSANPRKDLRFWHRALVHYGAYDCEKYRKDIGRGSAQLQLFEAELQKYEAALKPKQGTAIRMVKDYRMVGRMGRRQPWDPRA